MFLYAEHKEEIVKIPTAPTHLSGEGKQFWKRITRQYILSDDQLLTLRVACENFDLAQQAREEIVRDGLTVDGRRHPAVDIERQAYALFLRSLRQLNLDAGEPGPIGHPGGS